MSKIIVLVGFMLIAFPAFSSEKQEIETAIFKQYLEQAEAGDVTAQFVVARRLERGVGTQKDMEQAYVWYNKAAEKGHPLAQFIIDSKKPTLKPDAIPARSTKPKLARVAAPVASKALPASKAKPALSKALLESKAKPVAKRRAPVKVAKAASKPVTKQFNTEDIVMKGKWRRKNTPIGFLPSTRSSCLKANPVQVICFSEKFAHTVGAKEMIYSVKSTITGFDSSGKFDVTYLYNVHEVGRNKTNARSYAPNIAAIAGWQEPGQKLKCHLDNAKSVICKDRKGAVAKFVR